ncbi:cytochrome P450, partial [Aeromonas sp. EERV15]|uniref:cytochrome P450 n=1 Tax=Aeromonas sp. EERV15 TaxID=1833892 RepID=UPI001C3FFF42
DVSLGGATVPAGALVLALVASANRDERQYPDPDRFDLHRGSHGGLQFGHGIHFCIGAALARMEARAALEAGKHVVVDKPFTNTSAEADELIALAARKGRLLSVFQNRRWDADFLTVRRCIEQGLLGEVASYEAHFDRFRPAIKPGWRGQASPGSGIL